MTFLVSFLLPGRLRFLAVIAKSPETGASWVAEYCQLENEIRTRHYSPKTLKTYRGWVTQLEN